MAKKTQASGPNSTAAITDPRTLRAIAHPVRMRLYELLVTGGPATAAKLSAYVDGAPGSISYHLRQLAEHGYIQEAPEMSTDSRERWWRAVPGGVRWSPADFLDKPADQEVLAMAQQTLVTRQLERLHAWQVGGVQQWGVRWAAAAIATDTVLYLNPDELEAMAEDLSAVISRWSDRSRFHKDQQGPHDTDDRQQVFTFTHAFPITDKPQRSVPR
jgi:DNA-binding transcriptional ArsR family regulator